MTNENYKQNRETILENAKKYYLEHKEEQNKKCCIRQKAKTILSQRHKEEYEKILKKLRKEELK